MKSRGLHRRLAAIEAKFDEAAKAIERERRRVEVRSCSAEEAKLVYQQLIRKIVPSTEDEYETEDERESSPYQTGELSAEESLAQYLEMVRAPAPSQGKRR
jgi:hypothetical protein